MKVSYGKRIHCGELQESLKTSIKISEYEFKQLLEEPDNEYKYYCFDHRCNQILFLGKHELKYMWLFIQIET